MAHGPPSRMWAQQVIEIEETIAPAGRGNNFSRCTVGQNRRGPDAPGREPSSRQHAAGEDHRVFVFIQDDVRRTRMGLERARLDAPMCRRLRDRDPDVGGARGRPMERSLHHRALAPQRVRREVLPRCLDPKATRRPQPEHGTGCRSTWRSVYAVAPACRRAHRVCVDR